MTIIPFKPNKTPHADYGDFIDYAMVSQDIKMVLFKYLAGETVMSYQVEALEMIARRLARLIAGDVHHAEEWWALSDYARLVADELEREG